MGKPGSPNTIQKLFEDNYESLYRYAYRLSGSGADAEDLTQETFLKAQKEFSQLRDPARARGWLFGILRNAFLHSARRPVCVPLDLAGDVAEPAPEALPDIDQEQLQNALDELPEEYRTPVIMFYFEDFSYRDIAEEMKLPIGTVMSRLSRAKAYLRGRLVPADAVPAGAVRGRSSDGL